MHLKIAINDSMYDHDWFTEEEKCVPENARFKLIVITMLVK